MKPLLTAPDGNTKIGKNPIPTWSLNLAPARTSGLPKTMCPSSTAQCRATCLESAGRNIMPNAQQARQWRTELWQNTPGFFLQLLTHELDQLPDGSGVRLNALSDQTWEKHLALGRWPALQFYDYTKIKARVAPGYLRYVPNYDLTFSIGEKHSVKEAIDLVRRHSKNPLRIAIVAHSNSKLWDRVDGDSYVDGDEHDWRPGDPPSCVVLLTPKGKAASLEPHDRGFVKP